MDVSTAGDSINRAAAQARRLVHDNDQAGVARLLAEVPALLSWTGDHEDGKDGLLGFATGSYGDSFESFAEDHFTRRDCAELLIDAGAMVTPNVCDGILRSRTRGLLQLFHRKGLLPRALKFFVALGDIDAVRAALSNTRSDAAAINEAFTIACDFQHEAIAQLLLDRAIAIDPQLGPRIDARIGRSAFIKYFIDNRPRNTIEVGLWNAFVMERIIRAVYSWSGSETSFESPRGTSDLTTFVELLRSESWLLAEDFVDFQARIIERASLQGHGEFITALLDFNPAIARRQPPPASQALEFAFTYAKTHLVPVLTRIWPLPDDLPHAAGIGDLSRVKQWFDASGAPALGDLDRHYPHSAYMPQDRVDEYERQFGAHSAQRVLDSALAWAVINNHLDVAAFLLDHGADINTRWSSHEPASILHELVWHKNYDAMQFLIDRGIDMTITDYRWNATAQGWAFYAANDEKMAKWLADAEQRQANAT